MRRALSQRAAASQHRFSLRRAAASTGRRRLSSARFVAQHSVEFANADGPPRVVDSRDLCQDEDRAAWIAARAALERHSASNSCIHPGDETTISFV